MLYQFKVMEPDASLKMRKSEMPVREAMRAEDEIRMRDEILYDLEM